LVLVILYNQFELVYHIKLLILIGFATLSNDRGSPWRVLTLVAGILEEILRWPNDAIERSWGNPEKSRRTESVRKMCPMCLGKKKVQSGVSQSQKAAYFPAVLEGATKDIHLELSQSLILGYSFLSNVGLVSLYFKGKSFDRTRFEHRCFAAIWGAGYITIIIGVISQQTWFLFNPIVISCHIHE